MDAVLSLESGPVSFRKHAPGLTHRWGSASALPANQSITTLRSAERHFIGANIMTLCGLAGSRWLVERPGCQFW
jgi:hypothetical protein